MRVFDDVAVAFWALSSRPLRTVLSASALAAGVAAVTLAVAIITGYGRELERMSFGVYARSLIITENWWSPDPYGPPRLRDLETLRRDFGARLMGAAAWRSHRVGVRFETRAEEAILIGAIGDYRLEADAPVAAGRVLSSHELDSGDRACLVGSGLVRRLSVDHTPADWLDQRITLNGLGCKVVGVLAESDTRIAARFNDAVITPFRAAARHFVPGGHLGPDEADQITLVFRARVDAARAESEADRVMRRAHGAPLTQRPPFRFGDPNVSMRELRRQRGLIGTVLFAVASISMIAGIVGYAGVLITAADSRRRDFALQMACGAQRGDILLQVTLESTMTGLLGAVSGISLAAALGWAIQRVWALPIVFDSNAIAAAVISGLLAGLLAGAVPARSAAAAPPAAASRA